VTLGPLTNIALAMKLDKNFERNVKNFVIMGGTMEGIGGITPTSGFSLFLPILF
jgi:purine nucleosidase